MEQGEVGREPLLAETDALQRLHHLVEQDLVSCRREVEPVAASWNRSKCYPRLTLIRTVMSQCIHYQFRATVIFQEKILEAQHKLQIQKTPVPEAYDYVGES